MIFQYFINIPNIIPIEIINVTDITSIPKEVKEKKGKTVNKALVETKKLALTVLV